MALEPHRETKQRRNAAQRNESSRYATTTPKEGQTRRGITHRSTPRECPAMETASSIGETAGSPLERKRITKACQVCKVCLFSEGSSKRKAES